MAKTDPLRLEAEREKHRLYMRVWSKANRDLINARKRQKYAASDHVRSPERLAYEVAYRRSHRDRHIDYAKRWRADNLERVRAHDRVRSSKLREQPGYSTIKWRHWRDNNPEKIAAYRRTHHDQLAQYGHMRRVRERGAIGSHTAQEWREKILFFGGCCAYCGEAKPLTRDHRIPLTRRGTDYISNIVPACHSCNSRKRTRTDVEYIALRQRQRAA